MKENMIISSLLTNENYVRRVLPHIKVEYFQNEGIKVLVEIFMQYWEKYQSIPSRHAVYIELKDRQMGESTFEAAKEQLKDIKIHDQSIDWLVDTTEQYFKDRALYIALMKAIETVDSSEHTARGEIPSILSKALSVSFETNIGLDYLGDPDSLWEIITDDRARIPFHLSMLNKVTNGGIPRKTMAIFMGPTGSAKSLSIHNIGSNMAKDGSNVLIISLELSEPLVALRLAADGMDLETVAIETLSKDRFRSRMSKVAEKTKGRLFIKEYPPGMASAVTIQHILDEYRIKKNFVPDVLVLDYLTLLRPVAGNAQSNSYNTYKTVAEELRGIAAKNNLAVITAVQTNRGAIGASDYGMEATSDSLGIGMTGDLQIALIRTEELDAKGQIMMKQVKNRLRPEWMDRRFVVGLDQMKMRLYNIENATEGLMTDPTEAFKIPPNPFANPLASREQTPIPFTQSEANNWSSELSEFSNSRGF